MSPLTLRIPAGLTAAQQDAMHRAWLVGNGRWDHARDAPAVRCDWEPQLGGGYVVEYTI